MKQQLAGIIVSDKTIIYEQPLSEHIRVCLRLEHLFQQLKHHLQDDSVTGSHAALTTLLDITNVADRPDLRNKLSRVLSYYANMLAPLARTSAVNNQQLQEVLAKLDCSLEDLHLSHGRFGQHLQRNEFLNSIRRHLAKPGGICDFSFPAYHLWLQQPAEQRKQAIMRWLKEFKQLRTVVDLLLQLTRESSESLTKTAIQGFYQESLPPAIAYQMIRVILPASLNSYPKISVGRHRLSIYFFLPDFEGEQATQVNHDLEFQLTCCAA